MTVALPAPLNVTVDPLPFVIVPEMLNEFAIAVKFTAVALAPLIVTASLVGLKVSPLLLESVTV